MATFLGPHDPSISLPTGEGNLRDKAKRARKAGERLGVWRPRILANAAVRSGSTTSQMTYKRSLLVSMLLVSCRPPWRNYAQEQELKSRQGPTHIHFLCSVSMSCNPEIKRSASPRFNNTRGVTRRPWRCKNSTWAHFPLQTLSRAGNSSGLLRSACGFEPHRARGHWH